MTENPKDHHEDEGEREREHADAEPYPAIERSRSLELPSTVDTNGRL